ncbi:MAG: septal ring lytic transglycosylase RlpA family protein [Bradyrhizobium sp.]|nr:septal ring lytic transglycosylase RlpA family protein [Bradyrhizobium sp.]
MRTFSIICAVAIVPACIAINPSPAAAQSFDDRWSIIPKAHAEPAQPAPDQQAPNTQPPSAQSPNEHREAGHDANRTFAGKASFYSYRKAKTASGSSFDRDQLTAAHRSLPLGTKVRVTDVATNKSVVVRITDRGPFIRNRVLDLSLGAAHTLGIEDRGVIEIRADVL